ncbi:hypothetical protein V2154_13345 [Ewingella sp. CoE-038-23]|uniref:hypothetical protein n=1 Tax=Ewingella docleensis TaxID=3118588 RepID=UPI0033655E78
MKKMNHVSHLIGKKITIRFTDRSKSQSYQCELGATDGYNSIIYCQEGIPQLVGNSSFEVVKEGWRV